MLTAKRSTGVASELILRNPSHTGEEASTLNLKPRLDVTRSTKQGTKDQYSPKFKNKMKHFLYSYNYIVLFILHYYMFIQK